MLFHRLGKSMLYRKIRDKTLTRQPLCLVLKNLSSYVRPNTFTDKAELLSIINNLESLLTTWPQLLPHQKNIWWLSVHWLIDHVDFPTYISGSTLDLVISDLIQGSIFWSPHNRVLLYHLNQNDVENMICVMLTGDLRMTIIHPQTRVVYSIKMKLQNGNQQKAYR